MSILKCRIQDIKAWPASIFSALGICALRQGAEGTITVHNANTLKAFRLGTKLGRLIIVITHSKRLGEI